MKKSKLDRVFEFLTKKKSENENSVLEKMMNKDSIGRNEEYFCKATMGDLGQMVSIYGSRQKWLKNFNKLYFKGTGIRKRYKNLILKNSDFYVYKKNNEVLGFICFSEKTPKIWIPFWKPKALYISDFITSLNHKGEGVGGKILAEVQKYAERNGFSCFRGTVTKHNGPLEKWYSKNAPYICIAQDVENCIGVKQDLMESKWQNPKFMNESVLLESVEDQVENTDTDVFKLNSEKIVLSDSTKEKILEKWFLENIPSSDKVLGSWYSNFLFLDMFGMVAEGNKYYFKLNKVPHYIDDGVLVIIMGLGWEFNKKSVPEIGDGDFYIVSKHFDFEYLHRTYEELMKDDELIAYSDVTVFGPMYNNVSYDSKLTDTLIEFLQTHSAINESVPDQIENQTKDDFTDQDNMMGLILSPDEIAKFVLRYCDTKVIPFTRVDRGVLYRLKVRDKNLPFDYIVAISTYRTYLFDLKKDDKDFKIQDVGYEISRDYTKYFSYNDAPDKIKYQISSYLKKHYRLFYESVLLESVEEQIDQQSEDSMRDDADIMGKYKTLTSKEFVEKMFELENNDCSHISHFYAEYNEHGVIDSPEQLSLNLYDLYESGYVSRNSKEYEFLERLIKEFKIYDLFIRDIKGKNVFEPEFSLYNKDETSVEYIFYEKTSLIIKYLISAFLTLYADNYLNESTFLVNENFTHNDNRENFYDNRNSDGQEVTEPGKHSENVYLKDCPFLLGKDQVEFFKIMQAAKEKHTIDSVDDFMKSAKSKDDIEKR